MSIPITIIYFDKTNISYSNNIINDFNELSDYSYFDIIELNNYNNNSNLPWTNNKKHIIFNNYSNIGIGTSINLNNKLNINDNINIDGSILQFANCNLGTADLNFSNIYLSGKLNLFSNYLNCCNLELYDNSNNKLIISLSNNQFIYNSNGIIYNSIKFEDYKNIIYSQDLNNYSNQINYYLISNIINSNINADLLLSDNVNKFITNDIYNTNITFLSNINVLNNYYLNNFKLPLSIINNNISLNAYISTSNIFDLSNILINTSNKIYLENSNNYKYQNYVYNANNWVNSNTNIYSGNEGNIGIGTNNPKFKIDINGDINYTSNLFINSNIISFSVQSNTNIISSNSSINFYNNINSNQYAYFSFLTNGSITFPKTTLCDILVVGAGGRGGLSDYSGGGGAGEVIYSNLSLSSGLYNIQIGIDSSNNINRISKLSLGPNDIIIANGGGDGAYPYSSIRRYPPKLYNIQTTPVLSTFSNMSAYYQNITIDNLNITYGDGYYELWSSTLNSLTNSARFMSTLFNYTNPSIADGFHFAASQYNTSGTYNITNGKYLSEPNYLGDWFVIKLPIPIIITSYSFYQRTSLPNRSPKKFKLYACNDSNNWIILQDITNATYINYIYTNIDLKNNINPYIYYGVVVNQLVGGDTILNFNQWVINGKEIILTPSTSGGSGGGGTQSSFLITNGAIAGIPFDINNSKLNAGSDGNSLKGGDGGSALISDGYIEQITESSLKVGIGGFGVSNQTPIIKNTYGSGGDGNGGLGTNGIIIIKVPLENKIIRFDGYINYSNIINKPLINQIFYKNYIDIGYYNQVNFPLGNISFKNEWFLYQEDSLIFHHFTSNINSKWWFNGTIANTNNEISDSRVKKEVTEIVNPLDKLMLLKPKEYYLCDEQDYVKKYGIIAQDIDSNIDLQHLIYRDEDYIANIYSKGTYNNSIITSFKSIKNLIEINDEIKLILKLNNNLNNEIIIDDYLYNNKYIKRNVKIKKIIDDNSFEIYEKLDLIFEIFIYGKKVKDFNKLDYSSLYSLNLAGTQELYKIIQNNKYKLNELKSRVKLL